MSNENNNGNGKRPALAFIPNRSVPIIGQPFTIKGWFPTVMLVCNCEGKEPVMVPRGGASVCPSCRRVYTIEAIQGNVNFGIGVMTPEQVADAAKGALVP